MVEIRILPPSKIGIGIKLIRARLRLIRARSKSKTVTPFCAPLVVSEIILIGPASWVKYFLLKNP